MSSTEAHPPPPVKKSGVRAILRYTGIPPSWLDKRPKLPSRNWLIFLSVTSSALGWYVYDRRQCKKIRQEYIDKVKHFAEVPADPYDTPRRVTVYGAKWPGDDDYDQSLRYFRKYVKPILVAAAIDYNVIYGKRHGDIARRVAEDVRLRRRQDLGLDPEPEVFKALPTYKPLLERRKRELEGGIVLVGRPTLKEFMAGLKRGWTDGLEKVDRDEELARILEDDSHFDQLHQDPVGLSSVEDPSSSSSEPQQITPSFPSAQHSPVFSPLQLRPSSTQTKPSAIRSGPQHTTFHSPPSVIPPQPPLLLVPFLDYIGFKQMPLMIWDFFNQRHKVRSGAEAAYKVVMGAFRPLQVPEIPETMSTNDSSESVPPARGDLDFDKEVETYYNKSAHSIPKDIDKARQGYYDALQKRLATARELAHGIREPTKEEINNPPPTEVELRAERLKKEQRWRGDVAGWDIVKPSHDVDWDERFRGTLQTFVDPPEGDETGKSSL